MDCFLTCTRPHTAPSSGGPRILAVFCLQAMASGGLFTRIPDIQQSLGLNDGELGWTLMGQPLGAMATFLAASRLIEQMGTRMCLLIGLPLLASSVVMIALTSDAALAFAALAVFGAAFTVTNIAMNVEADRVEAATGRRIMNRCHGFWSIGFVIISGVGAAMRGAGLPPAVHFIATLPLLITLALVTMLPMRAAPQRVHDQADGRRPILVLPTRSTIMLLAFGISGVFIENGIRNWSLIYMRDSFDAPLWLDTLALPCFLLAMSVGRLISDSWVERRGPTDVATRLLLSAFVGLALLVAAPMPLVAFAGFALLGLGVCAIYPLTLTATAGLGDRPSAENVTSVSMMTSVIMLVAPALIGHIANVLGIRSALAAMLLLILLSLALRHVLDPTATVGKVNRPKALKGQSGSHG